MQQVREAQNDSVILICIEDVKKEIREVIAKGGKGSRKHQELSNLVFNLSSLGSGNISYGGVR